MNSLQSRVYDAILKELNLRVGDVVRINDIRGDRYIIGPDGINKNGTLCPNAFNTMLEKGFIVELPIYFSKDLTSVLTESAINAAKDIIYNDIKRTDGILEARVELKGNGRFVITIIDIYEWNSYEGFTLRDLVGR